MYAMLFLSLSQKDLKEAVSCKIDIFEFYLIL